MAAKRGSKKRAKRGAKKGARKFSAGGPRRGTTKVKASNVRGRKRGAHIPLSVLEKRLRTLNAKVKARGGKHY